jgi:cytochrome bd-type quinol oxidase subunit 2
MSDQPKRAMGRKIAIGIVGATAVCFLVLQAAIYVSSLSAEPGASMRLMGVFMIAPIPALLSLVLIVLLRSGRSELTHVAWRALLVVAAITLLIEVAFFIGG